MTNWTIKQRMRKDVARKKAWRQQKSILTKKECQRKQTLAEAGMRQIWHSYAQWLTVVTEAQLQWLHSGPCRMLLCSVHRLACQYTSGSCNACEVQWSTGKDMLHWCDVVHVNHCLDAIWFTSKWVSEKQKSCQDRVLLRNCSFALNVHVATCLERDSPTS